MLLELALVCQAANTAENDHLNILGQFTAVQANEFPVTVPQLTLVTRWSYQLDEVGERAISTILSDPAGDVVHHMEGTMELGESIIQTDVPIDRWTSPPLVIQLTGIQLATPGQYRWRILLEEETVGTVPFYVLQAPTE